MTHLAIDIGNSKVKMAVIRDFEILKIISTGTLSEKNLTTIRDTYQPNACMLSSVKKVSDNQTEILSRFFPTEKLFLFNHLTPLPIKNQYKTPETLGLDRIASAVYAAHMFPGENCLIIDAGTCITIDFLEKEKGFMGGSILPGIQMRFKALHNYTDKLPLLKKSMPGELTGTTTQTSIESGVLHAVTFEVDGFIQKYKEKYPNLKVLLTGGDTDFFETQLKNQIFALPNLVLLGLYKILIHNAKR